MVARFGFRPASISSQLGANRLVAADLPDAPIALTAASPELFGTSRRGARYSVANPKVIAARHRVNRTGYRDLGGPGDDFFEEVYLLPRSIDAGIILSTQVYTVEVYNAFRKETRSWTDYDDSSAGEGVSLGSPTPPPPTIELPPEQGSVHTLTVLLAGPPTIDGMLDFTVSGVLLSIPITGTRSVLFPFQPEIPILETLRFFTDVLTARSGKEQRRALRKTPRVVLEFDVLTDDIDRQLLDNLLFDGQDRAFGIPLWYEATELAADITASDDVITVNSTDYADYRVGGLAVVWQDPFNYEALAIASFTATTITFASPFTRSFTGPALVMPVHACLLNDVVEQSRYRKNLQRNRLRFTMIDNDNDLSDISAFNSYNSKVLLDDPNFLDGDVINETIARVFQSLDALTGSPFQTSSQSVSRQGSSKGFVTTTRQQLWEVRGLLHALKGRAVSFYLPTFYPDFNVEVVVASADQAIDVTQVSYADSVQHRQPRNVIRLHKKDGTMSAPKLVTGSSKPSAGIDRLSISPATIGINAALADIDRLELILKMRFDSDDIPIRHLGPAGAAMILAPTKAVLE